MEIITIQFTRPSTIPNVGCYRADEIAGFSRQLADRIIARGHGRVYKPETRPSKTATAASKEANK